MRQGMDKFLAHILCFVALLPLFAQPQCFAATQAPALLAGKDMQDFVLRQGGTPDNVLDIISMAKPVTHFETETHFICAVHATKDIGYGGYLSPRLARAKSPEQARRLYARAVILHDALNRFFDYGTNDVYLAAAAFTALYDKYFNFEHATFLLNVQQGNVYVVVADKKKTRSTIQKFLDPDIFGTVFCNYAQSELQQSIKNYSQLRSDANFLDLEFDTRIGVAEQCKIREAYVWHAHVQMQRKQYGYANAFAKGALYQYANTLSRTELALLARIFGELGESKLVQYCVDLANSARPQ